MQTRKNRVFFLGPGLISTFPCFRRSKKTKAAKKHNIKPKILKSQQLQFDTKMSINLNIKQTNTCTPLINTY